MSPQAARPMEDGSAAPVARRAPPASCPGGLPGALPEINWRSANLRSDSNYFHNPRVPKNAVPLGFCCGGFSSTAGYAPATKLNLR
jgi:hypothetical protein